jgi:hypothetical protein
MNTRSRKGRVSARAGFVHYLSRRDYHALCMTLHTPFEIAEYLDFRADFVRRNSHANEVSEKALVGKFLTDTDNIDNVTDEHELVVDRLNDDRNDFNISKLLWEFLEQIAYGNEGTQYHAIVRELAKLKRNSLREFRKRYEWAMEKCNDTERHKPSRFYPVEQNCAFIAIPLPKGERDKWHTHLKHYTHMCKYDLQSQRCLGYTMAADRNSPEAFCVHWLLLDFEWHQSDEMDELLTEVSFFRDVKWQSIGTYELR